MPPTLLGLVRDQRERERDRERYLVPVVKKNDMFMRLFVLPLLTVIVLSDGFLKPTEAWSPSTTTMTTLTTLTTTTTARNKILQRTARTTTQVRMVEDGDDGTESIATTSTAATTATGLDVAAIGQYVFALALQLTLIGGVFTGLDYILSKQLVFGINKLPFAVNFILFYYMSLKSRIFNPLSNARPQPSTQEVSKTEKDKQEQVEEHLVPQRTRPTWTPPGFIFPIVWLLLIGPLRATTSSMLIASGKVKYASKAIMSLMLHLSIGDIWNTINNVELRYGTSAFGVVFVWSSAAYAAYSYGQVIPLVGKLLSLKLIWLSIASCLVIRTWQLNPNPATGKLYSLLPTKGEGSETRWALFSK